jgi:uncharacterized membrane protein
MGKKFEVDQSIVIDAPIDAVFRYAADYRNDVYWRTAVRGMELSGADPFEVDVQIREVLRSFGRNVVSTGEVTAVEPNKSITFRSLTGPIPVEGMRLFQEVGEQTRFTFCLKGELDTFYSIMWIFMSGTFRRQIADSLEKLRGLLEDQRS